MEASRWLGLILASQCKSLFSTPEFGWQSSHLWHVFVFLHSRLSEKKLWLKSTLPSYTHCVWNRPQELINGSVTKLFEGNMITCYHTVLPWKIYIKLINWPSLSWSEFSPGFFECRVFSAGMKIVVDKNGVILLHFEKD
jgi:hypothetical protein